MYVLFKVSWVAVSSKQLILVLYLASLYFFRAKEFDLSPEDHYNYKIWEELGWPSPPLRVKGLADDIKAKRDNINFCKEYRKSGAKQKAKSNCTSKQKLHK